MTWRVEDRSAGPPGPRTFVIEESLGYLVNRAARAFAAQLAEELRTFDVGIGQWAVLLHLWSRDGVTQAQLARRVAIEQPTIVRTIDRMERDGLVTRAADPNDRRVSRITLTERGWALRDQLIPLADGVNRAATATLSEEEVATLRRLLANVVAANAGHSSGA
jgi:DNA-binding MarR family transcriptional regulator